MISYPVFCFATLTFGMFLSSVLSLPRAKLQLVRKATVHVVFSEHFLQRKIILLGQLFIFFGQSEEQTLQKANYLLPDISESRSSVSTHSIFIGFDCEWPLRALPDYREYSLAPGSPAEWGFQHKQISHYSELCILPRDNLTVTVLTNALELSALLCICCSSPAPSMFYAGTHTPTLPIPGSP